ncbi:hypothetical protein HNY73_022661 [Argiope bruennichi]|uniref:Uncharacterized protein n=1 Tax=Argiope bruennichi TaxID=94029 RepID=A0A8T0E2W4_ARGBR|nr:hypothetical protein HNY73_022661 [Argiope bruennichi]
MVMLNKLLQENPPQVQLQIKEEWLVAAAAAKQSNGLRKEQRRKENNGFIYLFMKKISPEGKKVASADVTDNNKKQVQEEEKLSSISPVLFPMASREKGCADLRRPFLVKHTSHVSLRAARIRSDYWLSRGVPFPPLVLIPRKTSLPVQKMLAPDAERD